MSACLLVSAFSHVIEDVENALDGQTGSGKVMLDALHKSR